MRPCIQIVMRRRQKTHPTAKLAIRGNIVRILESHKRAKGYLMFSAISILHRKIVNSGKIIGRNLSQCCPQIGFNCRFSMNYVNEFC